MAQRVGSTLATMMGKLMHYAADAILVSTILAGVKQSSGMSIDTTHITEPNIRNALHYYLSAGEFVFSSARSFAQGSSYFRPAGPVNPMNVFSSDSMTSNMRQYSHH